MRLAIARAFYHQVGGIESVCPCDKFAGLAAACAANQTALASALLACRIPCVFASITSAARNRAASIFNVPVSDGVDRATFRAGRSVAVCLGHIAPSLSFCD